MEVSLQSAGLNRSEAALLCALAQQDAPARLVDGLEPGAAAELRPLAEAIESLTSEERSKLVEEEADLGDESLQPGDQVLSRARGFWWNVVERWRESGELDWIESASMRRALRGLIEQWARAGRLPLDSRLLSGDSGHFDALLEMEEMALREFVAELGVFQMAEIVRGQNRRRIARVARKLPEAYRQLLVDTLSRDRSTESNEQARLREVFVTLSHHYEEFEDRVEQLGLYSVASAAGARYRDRIDALRERLPEDMSDRLDRYYRLSRGSTRRGVGRHFRAALESFLEWRDAREV